MSQPTDIFFFHSKSARALPGKGVHETVTDPAAYTTLKNNPRWREALSNFWVAPFTWTDGHRYNTVEHCFQAQKLCLAASNPFEETILFRIFCLDAPDQYMFASQDGSAAQKMRKQIVLSPHQLTTWDAQKEGIMESAQYAKFSQTPVLREILLATGKAQLWHGAARQPRTRMLCLERVRERLRTAPQLDADSDAE
jgi:ribA/ribD-fused uncharacterized protein